MKKKKLILFSVVLLLVLATGLGVLGYGIGKIREVEVNSDKPENVQGTVYYVDAGVASEDRDGKTPKTALKTLKQVNALDLQPGDVVLFKRDCRWIGTLRITASGTEEAPIIYGVYGEGSNKPRIDGEGIVEATVSGKDISYVEIKNLEITNQGDSKNYHRGLSIVAVNQNVEGIKVTNCYIHDVDSRVTNLENTDTVANEDKHWYGGIVIRARSNKKPINHEIILKDILVEKNVVDRCNLLGIAVGGAMTSFEQDKKCEGIVIRGNKVSNCWGDGIILFNDKNGLIEYNVAANNGQSDEGLNAAYAGIWIIWSEDCLIQYNESYGQGYSRDGQGFDIDGGCEGTIIQYNYSHDNAGGFLLAMQWYNGDAIIRHNLSINDSYAFITFGWSMGELPLMNLDVYNNTYFASQPILGALDFNIGNGDKEHIYAYFRNNIFCAKNGDTPSFVTNAKILDYTVFENNCYYGFSDVTIPTDEKNQLIADPKFAFAGASEIGFDKLDGYKLLSKSPCLQAGTTIFNNGGLDFWGNTFEDSSVVNIGAYAGEGTKRPSGTNVALTQSVDVSSVEGIAMLQKAAIARLVDGDLAKYTSTEVVESATEEQWIEITLDDVYEISKVVLVPEDEIHAYPVDFTISVCDANGNWENVVTKKNCKQPKSGEAQTYKFDKVSVEKIRIDISKLRQTEEGYQVALTEVQVY